MNESDWLLKEKYVGKKTSGFFADLKRLKSGEPLAYIIGNQPFLNATIYLDSRPLIPRTETEFWVEKLIAEYKRPDTVPPKEILDLCAGSGCIGIALAIAFPKSKVTFAEIDNNHHKTIKKNCQTNNISSNRYTIVGDNLFSKLTDKKFDLIVSNPPYIDKDLKRTSPSVINFEPAQALFAKDSGLQILRQIIKEAPKFLQPNGQLWLEHEPEQAEEINKLAHEYFVGYTKTDQYDTKRFSKLVLK